MTKRMLIDSTHAEETRVAVVEDGRLVEFDYESAFRKPLKGNIYLAKVTRVEPSLQAAFVNFGGNRHGFLPFSEIHPDYFRIPVADREALMAEQEAALREAEEADAQEEQELNARILAEEARNGARKSGSAADEDGVEEIEDDKGEIEEIGGASTADDDGASDEEGGSKSAHNHNNDNHHHHDDAHDGHAYAHEDERARSLDEDDKHGGGHSSAESDEADESEDGEDAQDGNRGESDDHGDDEGGEGFDEDDQDNIGNRAPSEMDPDGNRVGGHAGEYDGEGRRGRGRFRRGRRGGRGDGRGDNRGDNRGERGDNRGDRGGRGRNMGARRVEKYAEDIDPEQRFRSNLRRRYKIQEVIKRGQIMLVQVSKEERGNKGAAVGSYLSLPGRYCVLMPNSPRAGGVSRKIANYKDRARMREIMRDLEVPKGMSVILRTAGVTRTKAEIKRDLDYLMRLWDNICELTLESTAPALVYEEADLVKRAVRDLYGRDIEEIHVAGDEGFKAARNFMKMLMPSHTKKVIEFTDPGATLFNHWKIESQIAEIGESRVTLPAGGYLIINQTEALVAIDVNSGKATKERHIEETALRTNLEAAEEVARQLRLRDLGGLVVIDFIDMEDRRNNAKVERKMRDALSTDRARIQMGRISSFGLMELSRQRLSPSLNESQFEVCPTCQGMGRVRTADAASIMVLRAIEDEGAKGRASQLIVHVAPAVAMYILNHKRENLNDIESRYGFAILIRVDDDLGAAGFRVEVSRPSVKSGDEDEDEDAPARGPSGRGERSFDRERPRHRDRDRDRPVHAPITRTVPEDGPEDEDDFENEEGEAESYAEGAPGDSAGRSEDDKPEGRARRRGRRGGRRRGGRNRGERGEGSDSAEGRDEVRTGAVRSEFFANNEDSSFESVAVDSAEGAESNWSAAEADSVLLPQALEASDAPAAEPGESRTRGRGRSPAAANDPAAVKAPRRNARREKAEEMQSAEEAPAVLKTVVEAQAEKIPAEKSIDTAPRIKDYEVVNEAPQQKKKGWWNKLIE